MPKNFEVRDFAHFEQLCLKLGFRKIASDEIRKQLRQLKKGPSRHIEGREAGFQFDSCGLSLRVWTTYLETERRLREESTDSGWVLIIQNGEAVHFSRPALRTKNFLLNLYRRVWINWCRVSNRPSCPECGEYMNIKRGRYLKQRYWNCERWELHKTKRSHTTDFNYALPPAVKRWIQKVYKKRKRYSTQVKEAGKQPHAAMLKRKKWIPAKSETPKS